MNNNIMGQIVSITSSGQMTIPKEFREAFDMRVPAKAVIRKRGKDLIVTPRRDFWSLGGSLRSHIRLNDRQLREARNSFEKEWARKM